jgi:hypothetical protein
MLQALGGAAGLVKLQDTEGQQGDQQLGSSQELSGSMQGGPSPMPSEQLGTAGRKGRATRTPEHAAAAAGGAKAAAAGDKHSPSEPPRAPLAPALTGNEVYRRSDPRLSAAGADAQRPATLPPATSAGHQPAGR